MTDLHPASIRHVDHAAWRELAARFLDDNYQQSPAYARAIARRQRAAVEHVVIEHGQEIAGVATIRVRTLPLIGGGIAYVTGGPLTRQARAGDVRRLGHCLQTLSAEYVERRGLVLRVLAPVGSPPWNERASTAFVGAGMTPTDRSRRYRTLLLEIDRPLDEIRAGCSKYWRRNLRRAEQRPFVVQSGTTVDLFEPIQTLYARLRDRKGFHAPFDADFFRALQPDLPGDEQLTASVVQLHGEPVAGLVTSMLGDTCMPLLLAVDVEGLRGYAVYLLQWHSIVMARTRGLSYYDLGGIDPERNPGVYNFKLGLRGHDLCAPGPFERRPPGVRGAVCRGAEAVHRRLSRARPRVSLPASTGAETVLRRAEPGDVEQLVALCRRSFPESLRWQVGGDPARRWWRAVLPSASCETWVSAGPGGIQGYFVLVINERDRNFARRVADAARGPWLRAALRRPWAVAAHVFRGLRRRRKGAAAAPSVQRTPPGERTWVELIAVAPRCRGRGVAALLLEHAESRTRQMKRRAVQLTVTPGNRVALQRYARSGYGLVHESAGGLILGKHVDAGRGGGS